MAKMFPDVQQTRVIFASRAEQQFYQACQESLPDQWLVYSSCTLSTLESGKGMADNEIDFVLYHPQYGVLVVEVKGGRICFDADSGEFYSINRYQQSFRIKNPFKQVLIWKSRFLRFLRNQQIRVPVSHAVSFPTVIEQEIPRTSEIEPGLIIGVHRIQELEKSLTTIITLSQPEQYLRFDDIGGEIDRILRGTHFATRLHLRDYLDNHELRLKDIEVITETLITPIAGARRLAVEGEAGTGKTMLAIMLARFFRDRGKQVLLLSSNPLMNSILKKEAGKGVTVQTFIEVALTYGVDLLKKPRSFEGTTEDWTQFSGPEQLKQAIVDGAVRYDVMVCDEAQDVQPFWWEAFEALLQDQEDSRCYVFFDRSQGIFGSGGKDSSFVAEDVLPIQPPYFPLVHNYRTTREIAGFSRFFRTGKEILQSHCGRLGYKPELILYQDADDFKRQIKHLFRKLFEQEGLRTNDITVLSARLPFGPESPLHGLRQVGKYPLYDMAEAGRKKVMPTAKEIHGRVKVSTISTFKGLETSVGIVTNLSEYNLPTSNPIMASLIYVACTRAKHMLYLMLRQDDPKLEEIQKALNRVRQKGSMVLEGSSADYEFTGRITYFNPERVGWLKVDDPAFEKSTIMFFPHDVAKAQIKELKLGKQLRFRPRLEGQVTIACDLKETEL